MAKNFIFILLLAFTLQMASAQTSNLVLFSEKSEPFTLVLNGSQVNPSPALNVKVTNLQSANYHVRVIFNNPSLPEYQDQIFINPDNEATYALQSGAGLTQLRFVNEFSLIYRPIPPSPQQAIAYTGPLDYSQPAHGVSGGSASLDLQVDEQVGDLEPEIGTTTTTTITSGGSAQPADEQPIATDPLPGYTGPVGCEWPMDAPDFENAQESIQSQSFSDSKMRVAKQIARSNCLLTTQIKAMMGLFSFETDKLEFAKFAYDYTYDLGNYYKVNDAFSFESSIEDLENYLQNR